MGSSAATLARACWAALRGRKTSGDAERSRVALLLFYSEGAPHDKGLALVACALAVLKRALGHVDCFALYTPRALRRLGHGACVAESSEQGLVSRNPRAHLTGFFRWKPQIVWLELQRALEGDVLVYRDVNVRKYPSLARGYPELRVVVASCLKSCRFDFFVARESDRLCNAQHCKTNVLRELGEDHPFTYDFPLVLANFLIIRKSPASMRLVSEWLDACGKDAWMDGEAHGTDPCAQFRWHTPEQGVLSVLLSLWVRKGVCGIPRDYPQIIFADRDILRPRRSVNYEYLKLLDRCEV